MSTKMAPSNTQLGEIAARAERELNTHAAKVGGPRREGDDEVGVNSMVEQKFPGAKVKYHPDISTNAGYNRRISPEEGGEVDDRGRQTRGEWFEGIGGPEHKLEGRRRDFGVEDDNDALDKGVLNRSDIKGPGKERRGNDPLGEGASATRANVGLNPPGPGGSKFKGEDYYRPEEVPDSTAAEGYIPP